VSVILAAGVLAGWLLPQERHSDRRGSEPA
jgi:hypothetical protein